MSLAPGSNLEGYEILSLLGSGGMGEVYRARDVSLRRDVAIKVLPAFVSRDPERLRRFEHEAQATAALNHPNIVAIYQFGAFDGVPYLVSELLEGETLRQLVRRGPLPNRKAIEYVVQIARGLAAAHEKGIVHRDLKPENLFITNDGRLKILDFGIAKFAQTQSEDEGAQTHATDAGVVMGTAGYMSPEQVRGKSVDHRTDIFAFGAILYEMLSGKRAFQRSTSVETMTSILNDHPTEISQLVQTIPPGLQRVVNRCLEKNPEQRFQSASDLAFALEALTESGSSAAFLTTETRRTASFSRSTDRPRRKYLWPAIGASLVLAALAVAAWFFVKRFAGIPFAHYTIQRAMDSDHVRMTAISPDGMYLASIVEDPNRAESLDIRQIPTNTERQLLNNPQYNGYGGLSFSPDGSYIYFRASALGNPPPDRSDVYRIPILGGSPERVLTGVDEPAMFISGGQRMCFYREDDAAGTYQFVSASAEGGDEHILANGKAPFPAVTACDPKGERAIVEDELGKVEVLDFATGAKRALIEMASLGGYLTDLHWHPNGKGLFGIVRKQPTFVGQLVYLSYPGGVLSPITNDLSSYAGVSLTADARTLATRQTDNNGRLEVIDVADATRQEEHGPRGLRHFTWLDDNTIVASDQMSQLRMIDLQKEDTTTLHAAKGHWFIEPALCGVDTFVTVGGTLDKSAMHIYKMSHDGSLATQLTEGPYDVYPSCTPDGKYLFYADNHNPMQPVIKRLAMGIVNAQPETASNGFRYTLSSDGKLIGVVHLGGSPQLRILSAATLEKVQNVNLPPDVFRFAAFSADDRSIFFPTMTGADTTLWRVALDGKTPVKMATFPGKTVQWIRLSPDGQKLGLILETPQSEAVLLRDSR